MTLDVSRSERPEYRWRGIAVWLLGLLAVVIVYTKTRDQVVNVVNFELADVHAPVTSLSLAIPLLTLAALLFLLIQRHRERLASVAGRFLSMPASRAGIPLVLPLFVAGTWLLGHAPDFVTLSIAIVGFSWSMDRLGCQVPVARRHGVSNPWAMPVLVVVLLASTVWHTWQQNAFWQHFMLGYADFGLFTTELEHCLPWKDVGAARFSDTRMGYHCVPMFYLLVPFYALFRSPVFLMAVGTFALNLAAVPFYQLAKHKTGSCGIALLVGMAWLALPSVSRLPYSNTYGFQSIYLATPWLAWAFSLGMQGRWRGSHICLAAAMLCEETVCGVALGWGCYLFFWGGDDGSRRRDGACIVAASILYVLLCTTVIIPAFQGAGEYTRLRLFGDLSASSILDRFTRPRVPLYLLALTAPLLPAAARQWRILTVALPTLVLVLLLQDADYLNIKYWHHTSILPVIFVAATLGVCGRRGCGVHPNGPDSTRARPAIGPPLGLLVGVLLFQLWTGSTPFAQIQRIYAASGLLQNRDPRMEAVDYVRSTFSPEETTVVATERMAAHFIDYRMVHSARSTSLADTAGSPHLLIIDCSDRWDKLWTEQTADEFLARAKNAGYATVRQIGPVVVLARP